MRRVVVSIIIIAAASWIAWQYVPEDLRTHAAALFGIAREGDRQAAEKFLRDIVLPENPAERRRVLIDELEKNISELKQRVIPEVVVSDSVEVQTDRELQKSTTEELIEEAEKLIEELEKSAGDKSTGTEIRERIIERVLPSRPQEEKIDCSVCGE